MLRNGTARRNAFGWALVLTLGTASCSGTAPPIPVLGSADAVGALVGDWSGEYASETIQRHGEISFSLVASADTAHGDVLMQPSKTAHGRPVGDAVTAPGNGLPDAMAARSLRVSFVRATGDSVYGRLDPYDDPDCGCRVDTRFAGRLKKDTIEGRYVSRRVESGERIEGTWRLERRR
jgi:hypothetical protein